VTCASGRGRGFLVWPRRGRESATSKDGRVQMRWEDKRVDEEEEEDGWTLQLVGEQPCNQLSKQRRRPKKSKHFWTVNLRGVDISNQGRG
jgi:hypothetical protein